LVVMCIVTRRCHHRFPQNLWKTLGLIENSVVNPSHTLEKSVEIFPAEADYSGENFPTDVASSATFLGEFKEDAMQRSPRPTELLSLTERFQLQLAIDNASESTQDLYARTFAHLHAARITLRTFERPDLLNRIKAVAPKDWQKSTLVTHLTRVVTFANWLRAEGLISRKHQAPKQTKRPKLRELPTDEEIEQLLFDLTSRSHHSTHGRRRTRTQDEIITRLLIETGARISEVLALQPRHIVSDDFGSRIVIEGTKTLAAERAVQITHELSALIRGWLTDWQPPTPMMFRTRTDQPLIPGEFAKWLKAYCAALGIQAPITPHVLRHRWIFVQIVNGMEAFELMTRIGHSSIEMTTYYFNQVRRLLPFNQTTQAGSSQHSDPIPRRHTR
jgi:integrase